MSQSQACKNPIEDQRKQALEHYNELATKCCHWSSFVENAIKAYNPESPSPLSGEEIKPFDSVKAELEGTKEIARARGEAITELQKENEGLKLRIKHLEDELKDDPLF